MLYIVTICFQAEHFGGYIMRLRYYGIPWIRPKVDEPVKKFFMKFGKLKNYKKGRIYS